MIPLLPQVLCLQLRRVFWTRSGRLAKISGRVDFPELLDLSQYSAAAAEPLLPAAQPPLASHPLASLSCWGAHGRAPHGRAGGSGDLRRPAAVSVLPKMQGADTAADSCLDTEHSQALAASTAASSQATSCADHQASQQIPRGAADQRRVCGQDVSLHYRLVSVVVHHGGAHSGHYTVYRRVSSQRGSCVAGTHSSDPTVDQSSEGVIGNVCAGDRDQGCFGNGAASSYGRGDCHASRTCEISMWLHASDEHVRTADLVEVLSCEATVLLYERCSGVAPGTSTCLELERKQL